MGDEEPFGARLAKSITSGFVGMFVGVVIAEVVANSLIEISATYAFSIVKFIHVCTNFL